MPSDTATILEANLTALKTCHPKVWEVVQACSAPAGEALYPAEGSAANLKVQDPRGNSVFLHPQKDPAKDGTTFLNQIPEQHQGFVAILGLGLGYPALDIFKHRPLLQKLALFELDPGIFRQALTHTDLSSLFSDPRLILHIGEWENIPQILAPAENTLQLEDAKILYHSPSRHINPEGYNKLNDAVYAHLNSLNVGGATTRQLGKDFLNNRFSHVTTLHHHQLLEQIQDSLKGIPCILVAGGPSLDQNIHHLKAVKDRAVIIAVDTVLPVLFKHGIQPHFMTCIDPNNLTFEKFSDVISQAENVSLICSSWVNKKTPGLFPAHQVFWTFTGKAVEAWLNRLYGGKVNTGGASTVAHLNLIAAHMLGCDPVVFVGQDLAYPAKTSHATGTVLQGTRPDTGSTTLGLGETVKGLNGEILQTHRSFLSMKTFLKRPLSSPRLPISMPRPRGQILKVQKSSALTR